MSLRVLAQLPCPLPSTVLCLPMPGPCTPWRSCCCRLPTSRRPYTFSTSLASRPLSLASSLHLSLWRLAHRRRPAATRDVQFYPGLSFHMHTPTCSVHGPFRGREYSCRPISEQQNGQNYNDPHYPLTYSNSVCISVFLTLTDLSWMGRSGRSLNGQL